MPQYALYIRTSTRDQDGQAQLFALRRAARARGWRRPREFLDLGQSGVRSSRPALDQLRAAIQSGEISHVMVSGLDRLGRNLSDLLRLFDEFTAAGAVIVSLREHIDLSTPTGRLLLQLMGALAEFERELIAERRAAGLARAKAEGTRSGKPIGRPRRAVDVGRVAELREAGRSWREIAVALKCPSRTLRRVYATRRGKTSA